MKEENTKSKKRILYYAALAICVLLLVAATVLTVYFVSDRNRSVVEEPPVDGPVENEPPVENLPGDPLPPPSVDEGKEDPAPDTQTGGDAVRFVSPIAVETYAVRFDEIYENRTVKRWYRHKAIDFMAEKGAEVRCIAEGTVEAVSFSEELGNLIVVDHGGGLRSAYRFVEPVSSISVGSKLSQGQVIGAVADAYGSEAKDGTHLHFEMTLNEQLVDPEEYLSPVLGEK